MLIAVPEAARRYDTTRHALIRALARGDITRHEQDGVVVLDTCELDTLYASIGVEVAEAQPAAERTRDPRLPSANEFEAAVARVIDR